MELKEKTSIAVKATINVPVERAWKCWTRPEDIVKWNHASDDWHSPRAENDLRTGGNFSYRMEARDGSMGFDFEGVYDQVILNQQIRYTLDDGRKVNVVFTASGNKTILLETFEAEDTNPVEMQRGGWQAILDNFKKHAEATYH